MKLFASTFAVLALLTVAGRAAPLDTKNVAADAKWVVHVNVNAIRDSLIVKKAFESCPFLKDESGKHFDMIRDKIGVDLRKDLHGITLYGPDADKTHAVTIVFAKVDEKLLLDKVQKAADHKVTRVRAARDPLLDAEARREDRTRGRGLLQARRAGLRGQRERGRRGHDGAGRQVARHYRSQVAAGRPAPGGLDLRGPFDRHSAQAPGPVLQQAESFRVALGESDGKSFYHANVVMKTPLAATEVKAIADGFKALGGLKFTGNAEVLKLVNGLQTSVQDKSVKIRWDAAAADVWTVVEKAAKKAAEHMKAAGKGDGKGKADGKVKEKAPISPEYGDGT